MHRGDGRTGGGDGVSAKGPMTAVVPPPVWYSWRPVGSVSDDGIGSDGISGGDYGRKRQIQQRRRSQIGSNDGGGREVEEWKVKEVLAIVTVTFRGCLGLLRSMFFSFAPHFFS